MGTLTPTAKVKKINRSTSNSQYAFMYLQDQVWESVGWCVGVTEPLTAYSASQPLVERKRPSRVFHPSHRPSSKSWPVRPGRCTRNRNRSPLQPGSFLVLPLAYSIHEENPPKFVSFSSPILKSILTCIQASLGGTRVVKWGIRRRTATSVAAHVRMHVCLVAVLPYVGFTVSHFNDTHSSTQSAIVHPTVQPGNMDKEIQMWGQLTYLKNGNKSGCLDYQHSVVVFSVQYPRVANMSHA